jgi:peroxiredoxin
LHIDEFRKRGARVVAVVVDPVAQNAAVTRKLGLGFPILSDPDLAMIDAYGLRHANGIPGSDIARPATFVLDANGVVRWRDLTENYRVRPRPEDVLRAVDAVAER